MAGRLERAGMEELQESDAARSLRVAGKEKGVLQTGLQSTLNSPAACWKQAVWFLKIFRFYPFVLACGQDPRFRVTKGVWKQSVAACLWQAFGGMNRALQARLRDTMSPTAFPQKEFVRQPTASSSPCPMFRSAMRSKMSLRHCERLLASMSGFRNAFRSRAIKCGLK